MTELTMTPTEIVDTARDIAREYRQSGLTLTLRQLYYQFVSRGLLGSSQKVYKRIGNALTKARLDGRFPIEWIEDRGRTVGQTECSRLAELDDAEGTARYYVENIPTWALSMGKWLDQHAKVWVWIEKEALAGVFEGTCNGLGVGLFPCRGYPSVSALAAWVEHANHVLNPGDRAVILYCGDHDPDGLQIPRSAVKTIKAIQRVKGMEFDFELRSIALTMAQIQQYDPPPFEAKMTSARYQSYVDETGTDNAWELDALEPRVLQRLIRTEVKALFDDDVYDANLEIQCERRLELRDRMATPGWIESVMAVD